MKISVLSAVWNEGPYIAEMIESIRSQPHQDWELVLVDDASTDDTVAVIESYAAMDDRIKLVSKGVKLGVVGAFNTAYAHATGDAFSLLAGDDRLVPGSFEIRELHHPRVDAPAASFYKLRTFSTDKKFDGAVLPKGRAGSRSGAGITMNRALADLIFPIPTTLRAEDIWMAAIVDDLAQVAVDVPEVIMEYRIHEGNSNPRQLAFPEMSERMHHLNLAYREVLDADRFRLSPAARGRVEQFVLAEEYRHHGQWWQVLTRTRLKLVDRLAFAAMASPALYALRLRFFRLFSGLRAG